MLYSYIRKTISQGYKPTIGADFFSKKLEMPINDEVMSVTLQLWDTAGQERYQALGTAFYRGAEACILVYDITSQESFDHLSNWKHNFLEKCSPKDPENFPFFVFGNKKDKEHDREVSQVQVKEWISTNNDIPFQETSALDSQNIELAFDNIASTLLQSTIQ